MITIFILLYSEGFTIIHFDWNEAMGVNFIRVLYSGHWTFNK